VVRRCVRSRNLVNEEALTYWGEGGTVKNLAILLAEAIKMTV